MPRSSPELLALIASGALEIGTVLQHQHRKGSAVTALVVEGGIRIGERVMASPTEAARSITGSAINGWDWWRLPDGRALSSVRTAQPKTRRPGKTLTPRPG